MSSFGSYLQQGMIDEHEDRDGDGESNDDDDDDQHPLSPLQIVSSSVVERYDRMWRFEKARLGFYVALWGVTTVCLATTLWKHPRYLWSWWGFGTPFANTNTNTNTNEWGGDASAVSAWATATTVDYYGVCLCLCGIILASEPNVLCGLGWCFGCLWVGRSSVCCAWIILRLLHRGRSLRLLGPNDTVL